MLTGGHVPRPYQPPRHRRPHVVKTGRGRVAPRWLPLLGLIPLAGAIAFALSLRTSGPVPSSTPTAAPVAVRTTAPPVAANTIEPPVVTPTTPSTAATQSAGQLAATSSAVGAAGTSQIAAPATATAARSGLPPNVTAAPAATAGGTGATTATRGQSGGAAPGAALAVRTSAPTATSSEEAQTSPQPYFAYRVQPGDTLRFVASMYGVSSTSVAQASGLRNPDKLQVGQILTVPRESGWLHRVQAGETLDQVAAAYGVPTDLVERANGLASAQVSQGVVLLIPNGAPPASK